MIVEQDGEQIILPRGEDIQVGDTIVIHPTSDGDWVTHGKSRIAVGDTVVVVPLEDGDLAALNGAYNPWCDCPVIRKTKHDVSVQNIGDDSFYYHEYIFRLNEPIKRDWDSPGKTFPRTNVRLDFDVDYNLEGFQCFWPYGAVWIGVSEDGNNYWWCGHPNPHMVLSASPMYDCGYGSVYCRENWLNSCGSINDCCPPPLTISEVNYFKVHIRNGSSLYWNNYTKTALIYFSVCVGTVHDGWCRELPEDELRRALSSGG